MEFWTRTSLYVWKNYPLLPYNPKKYIDPYEIRDNTNSCYIDKHATFIMLFKKSITWYNWGVSEWFPFSLFEQDLNEWITFHTYIYLLFYNELLFLFSIWFIFCKPLLLQGFYLISTIVDPLSLFLIIYCKFHHNKPGEYLQYYCTIPPRNFSNDMHCSTQW